MKVRQFQLSSLVSLPERAASSTGWRWLIYFIFLLCIAMPHGLKTKYTPFDRSLTATSTLDGVIYAYSGNGDFSDMGLTAYIARKNVIEGNWAHASFWPMWPPGMLMFDMVCYWISPITPLPLILMLIVNGLWAGVFTQASGMARKSGVSSLVAFVLPLFMLMMSDFTTMTGARVFMTESTAIPAFLLGLGLVCNAAIHRRLRYAAMAGVFIAMSAYTRAQTDLTMSFALKLLIVIFAWALWRYRSFSWTTAKRVWGEWPWVAALAVCLLSYHACTMPYRATHKMMWVAVEGNAEWRSLWRTDQHPFWVQSGGAGACIVDPEACAKLNSDSPEAGTANFYKHTIHSFLRHPWGWISYKMPYLIQFWVDGRAEGALLMVLGPLLLIYCLKRRESPAHMVLGVMLACTTLGVMGPLVFSHIEPRYMWILKFMIFQSALLTVGWSLSGTAKQERI